MADKFEIRVRCASCGSEERLMSASAPAVPALFDDAESALRHVESLRKKAARIAGVLGVKTATGLTDDAVHECAKCHATSRMRDMACMVFRRPE